MISFWQSEQYWFISSITTTDLLEWQSQIPAIPCIGIIACSIFLQFVQFSFVTGFENEANYEIHDCEALPVTVTDEEANMVSPGEMECYATH